VTECGFCGFTEAEPEWYHKHEQRGYGREPDHNEDIILCGFCYQSYAASRWLAGNQSDTEYMERDQLMIANMLRLEIRETRA
jgi:hypothetical protein